MKKIEKKPLVARHLKLIVEDDHAALNCDRCELLFFPGSHIASIALPKMLAFLKDHERCELR